MESPKQNTIPPKSSLGDQLFYWAYSQSVDEGLITIAWMTTKQIATPPESFPPTWMMTS